MCQRLAQCKLCVLDKKVLSYTAISLGKAKNNIIAECCAATLLHVNISVCEAYFQSYKKSIYEKSTHQQNICPLPKPKILH